MTFAMLLLVTSCLFSFLLVYPYLFYPVVLRALKKEPIAMRPTGGSMSLLFCAYNERASIDAKLQNLRDLKSRMPGLEIIAYDDGSSDGTREKLSDAADSLTVIVGEGRRGKAAGMKRLAKAASGDILVFTDANVILRLDALTNLLPYYGDASVGGVCGTLQYCQDDASPTAKVGSEYWSLDEKLRSLESATGNVMGADGSVFSIRRSLYPEFPDSVLDDFVVSLSVVFAGKRLVKAPDVIALENSVASPAEEFRRKIRIGTRAYHTHLWMRDRLKAMSARDRFKYISRKYLRWFGGAFLLGAVVSGAAGLALIAPWVSLTASIAGMAAIIAALKLRRGPLAKAGDILRALMGTLIGVSRGMRGQVVQTWSPAVSR